MTDVAPAGRVRRLRRKDRPPALVVWVAALMALVSRGGAQPAAPDAPEVPPAVEFAAFLAERGIDRAGRRVIEDAATWDDAVQQAAVRVLLRLAAPDELLLRWRGRAADVDAAAPAVDDRLVAVRGRAVFVAAQPLTAGQRDLAAGRDHVDVVRVITASGRAVDVLVPAAPRGWPRGRPIDEPAEAYGLPLSTTVGPRPPDWPAAAPALVVAARRLAWLPRTPLGGLGMDHALFDSVVDGRRLEPGDSDAFFAVLAACGRQRDVPGAAPTDVLPLIDPARAWFAAHRGEEVVIAGTVRRATRIAIDEPARREQVGADHYWELFVFVPTPPLSVDGMLQDSFPVVCCVRELAPGLPQGDGIAEPVVVRGFAFKRYAYPLADAVIDDQVRTGMRRETPLVIGRQAAWGPRPGARGPGAVFAVLAAAVAAALAWHAWTVHRDGRRAAARARAALPDAFRLPGDGD